MIKFGLADRRGHRNGVDHRHIPVVIINCFAGKRVIPAESEVDQIGGPAEDMDRTAQSVRRVGRIGGESTVDHGQVTVRGHDRAASVIRRVIVERRLFNGQRPAGDIDRSALVERGVPLENAVRDGDPARSGIRIIDLQRRAFTASIVQERGPADIQIRCSVQNSKLDRTVPCSGESDSREIDRDISQTVGHRERKESVRSVSGKSIGIAVRLHCQGQIVIKYT